MDDSSFVPTRNGSVGNIVVPDELLARHLDQDQIHIMETIKRLDLLRDEKSLSMMIRATPNSVRWNEINHIQYKFQALTFRSDVLEALIQNSPPSSRRSFHVSDEDDDVDTYDTRARAGKYARHARVQCIRRSSSIESSQESGNKGSEKKVHSRKASVVQIAKDDTSDYNSDEDVFSNHADSNTTPNNHDNPIKYNLTLCHVTNRKITDTTELHISNDPEELNFDRQDTSPESASDFSDSNDSLLSTSLLSDKSKDELISLVSQLKEDLRQSKESQMQMEVSGDIKCKRESLATAPSVSKLINNYQKLATPQSTPIQSPIPQRRKLKNSTVGGKTS